MDMRETAMVSFRGLSRVVAALAGLLVIFAFLVSPLQGAEYTELLIGLKPGAEAPPWPDGVAQVRPIPGSRLYRVWVEPARVEEVIAALQASGQVEFVEKAKAVTIQSASTEEKAASRGLQASAERSQFAVIDYEPAEGTSFPAWQGMVRMTYLPWIADGAGVVVAVLDTGFFHTF